MNFYNIKDDYINYLKTYDNNVLDNKHESRPYVGIVLSINKIYYFAPLTSPKEKHKHMKNDIDFRKIDGGKLGAINLNNMIPVKSCCLIDLNISKVSNSKYRRLLQNQYQYIVNDEKAITRAATKLRLVVVSDDSELNGHNIKVKQRCCNLKLLESIYNNYQK